MNTWYCHAVSDFSLRFPGQRRVGKGGVAISSLQCYSVLSDILVKNELCIPLERGSNFYLLVKVSFAYLLPVSLKSLCVSVLSTKRQFRSVL